MARPTSPQQMAQDYAQGVSSVTQEDYCAPQVALGVRPDVCAARFARYQRRVQGKAQKFIERWQNA
jgi:hypothetical protein